jgi:hypothetical protein
VKNLPARKQFPHTAGCSRAKITTATAGKNCTTASGNAIGAVRLCVFSSPSGGTLQLFLTKKLFSKLN